MHVLFSLFLKIWRIWHVLSCLSGSQKKDFILFAEEEKHNSDILRLLNVVTFWYSANILKFLILSQYFLWKPPFNTHISPQPLNLRIIPNNWKQWQIMFTQWHNFYKFLKFIHYQYLTHKLVSTQQRLWLRREQERKNFKNIPLRW